MSTVSRDRVLSEQGRSLFKSGLALTSSSSTSPRSLRKERPGHNAFQALREEDSEDEGFDVVMESDGSSSPENYRTSPYKSPRGGFGWQMVSQKQKAMPKFALEFVVPPREEEGENGVSMPPSFPVAFFPPANTPSPPMPIGRSVSNEEDLADLSNMTMNTKGRRDTQRRQHGSKANQFKAKAQRDYNIGRRSKQREANKASEGGNKEEGEGDYDE